MPMDDPVEPDSLLPPDSVFSYLTQRASTTRWSRHPYSKQGLPSVRLLAWPLALPMTPVSPRPFSSPFCAWASGATLFSSLVLPRHFPEFWPPSPAPLSLQASRPPQPERSTSLCSPRESEPPVSRRLPSPP